MNHLNAKRQSSIHKVNTFKKEVNTDLHCIDLDDLYGRLQTNPISGLTLEKAGETLKSTGQNILTKASTDSHIKKLFKAITQGFSSLLWIGAFLCYSGVITVYLTENYVDIENIILGTVLIILVICTGIFMYYEEQKSTKLMDSFSKMIPQNATVIRDGLRMVTPITNLVIGDLIYLEYGDVVPADIRLIYCENFKVDNSSFTGESEPLLRGIDCTDVNILETKNVAFFSSHVVEGSAYGIVVLCGDNTIMGRIAGLTSRLKPLDTPLTRELHLYMRYISYSSILVGATIGTVARILGYSFLETGLFIIGIIISTVPEGLLPIVNVSLAIAARIMAKKNCLVKHLDAIETLGTTSVICSDKTGTLTQNRMSVCHLWINEQIIKTDLQDNQSSPPSGRYKDLRTFYKLMRCLILCSRVEILGNSLNYSDTQVPLNRQEFKGDASEIAFMKFAVLSKTFKDIGLFRKCHYKLAEIPFNSANKYQLSLHPFEDKVKGFMKGAPEKILDKCSTIRLENDTLPLTSRIRKSCELAFTELASKGERVFGFCDITFDKPFTVDYEYATDPLPNFPTEGYRLLGFVSLLDPPRPQIKDAITKCRLAGIKIVMITGDHPLTAKTIAQQVGILTSDASLITGIEYLSKIPDTFNSNGALMIGSVLRELEDNELDDVLCRYEEVVFARTSPTQKLQIVESFQRLGFVVAMTGDGVNDSPALKQADVGIAMGITGSEVSKESSDIVLLDDNFASIVTGIEEGRKIFDNLRKSVVYIMTSNVPEVVPFLTMIFFNIPLPIGVLPVLCIDIVTDMMPAITLAYEKAESDVLIRKPRNLNTDNLVSWPLCFLSYAYLGIIETLSGMSAYFIIMTEYGFYPTTLFGLRSNWDNSNQTVLDDLGREWSYDMRKRLQYTCSTAFMVAVVCCQCTNVVTCKTKITSIFKHGLSNIYLNLSIIIQLTLAAIISYAPYMYYLHFYPLKYRWWLYNIPYAILLLFFDEYRKYCIRNWPQGYFARETWRQWKGVIFDMALYTNEAASQKSAFAGGLLFFAVHMVVLLVPHR